MRAISGRRFGRGVLFVSIFAGYAADGFGQEYIREFYPYQRDAEAYAPMLQTDTALFYRAVQTATDLYGANTDYNLPMVAVGRRGRTYADESTLLNGMPIENYRTVHCCGFSELPKKPIRAQRLRRAIRAQAKVSGFFDSTRPSSCVPTMQLSLSPTGTIGSACGPAGQANSAKAGKARRRSKPARAATCTSKEYSPMR